jgi:hypothetical protein
MIAGIGQKIQRFFALVILEAVPVVSHRLPSAGNSRKPGWQCHNLVD